MLSLQFEDYEQEIRRHLSGMLPADCLISKGTLRVFPLIVGRTGIQWVVPGIDTDRPATIWPNHHRQQRLSTRR